MNANIGMIELMNCEITALGCEFLSKALFNLCGASPFSEKPPQLSVLKLDHNPGLGDQGIAVLADSLRNDKLTMLSLAYCGITEVGAQELFEVLIY